MTGRRFIDTNVVVYAYDSSDAFKRSVSPRKRCFGTLMNWHVVSAIEQRECAIQFSASVASLAIFRCVSR